jgi:hypothetical protein
MWLKKGIIGATPVFLIYQVPLSAIKKDKDVISNIIKYAILLGNYTLQEPNNTNMITEEAYAPYLSKITLMQRNL